MTRRSDEGERGNWAIDRLGMNEKEFTTEHIGGVRELLFIALWLYTTHALWPGKIAHISGDKCLLNLVSDS